MLPMGTPEGILILGRNEFALRQGFVRAATRTKRLGRRTRAARSRGAKGR
jgi:hypothetical protein